MAGPKYDKSWSAALNRAVRRESAGKGSPRWMEVIADRCVAMAAGGDLQAMKEVGDRIDGKPKQAIDIESPEGTMTPKAIERVIIDPTDKNS